MAAIVARENFHAHNHLAALSVIKPGLLRRAALKVVFAAIAQLATHQFRPGWLGTLGTIHFARWVRVPGTRDLIFLSNYGGSFESYLEDFITKAHVGLTGVWSNTEGFPRTSNLVQQGASDGDFFKRWARRQQIPTGCWYSAYPQLTTTNIRTNAAIRQGLGTILTEEEARRWLLLFGAGPRPAVGARGERNPEPRVRRPRIPEARDVHRLRARRQRAHANGWRRCATTCRSAMAASSATARSSSVSRRRRFASCDLPEEALATFPSAFLHGMAAPSRSRILGDDGANAPAAWKWGAGGRRARRRAAACTAMTPHALETTRRAGRRAAPRRTAIACVMEIPFVDLPGQDGHRPGDHAGQAGAVRLRRRRLAAGHPRHLQGAARRRSDPPRRGRRVHPGLSRQPRQPAGRPDARRACTIPDNVLPIATAPQHGFARPIVNDERDLGRNGTFLAIRQLEQDVEEFWQYCAQTAGRLHEQFPHWGGVRPEFVGAKLIGRWPDGSSVVRFPYQPGSEVDREQPLIRPGQGPVDVVEALLPSPSCRPSLPRSRKPSRRRGRPQSVGEVHARGSARHHREAGQRLPLRRRRSAGTSLPVWRAHPPGQSARELRARIAGTARDHQSPPNPPRGPALPAGRQRTSGPVLHVPERRSRTAVRVRAADLAAGAVVSRSH